MGTGKVQVTQGFLNGVKLLLDELQDHPLDKPTKILCKALESELTAKFEALERRKAFTEYKKTQSDTEERENKRTAYLDHSGIHKDWRSQKEIHS